MGLKGLPDAEGWVPAALVSLAAYGGCGECWAVWGGLGVCPVCGGDRYQAPPKGHEGWPETRRA